jgi:hypothetical protein
VRIQLRLALGLPLRAALGIPGSSVGPKAICVGTDRLARALAARRQRLAIGTHPDLRGRALLAACVLLAAGAIGATRTAIAIAAAARLPTAFRAEVVLAGTEPRHESAGSRTAVLAERVRPRGAALAAASSGTASTPTAATIAGTAGTGAGTTGTAAVATAARAAPTWAASTTGTPSASAIAEVPRRRRELPADAGARHLAATRPIVFLLVFLVRAGLEAAQAARLIAIATAAATAPIVVAPTALRTGDAVDDVVELAARDRPVWTLLALEHAHEANLVDPVADDVERLEQTLGALGLNTERRSHGVDGWILFGRLGLALTARLRGRGSFARRFRGRFGCRCRLRRCRPAPTGCRTRSGRVTEQQRGEFGEGLHRTG